MYVVWHPFPLGGSIFITDEPSVPRRRKHNQQGSPILRPVTVSSCSSVLDEPELFCRVHLAVHSTLPTHLQTGRTIDPRGLIRGIEELCRQRAARHPALPAGRSTRRSRQSTASTSSAEGRTWPKKQSVACVNLRDALCPAPRAAAQGPSHQMPFEFLVWCGRDRGQARLLAASSYCTCTSYS